MAERQTVAALVVTHDRLDKLRVTVARLLAEDLDHIVIFDNNSADGTMAFLDGIDDPRLIAIRHPQNLGGAGGFEQGLRFAVRELRPDWIVVMDDDGRPAPGAIARFRAMDPGAWDAVAAAVMTPSGGICEMNRPYRNPFWRVAEFARTISGQGRRGFHLGDDAYRADAGIVEVDMSSFVGLFLSRACFERAGYPDGRLFVYGDDQLYTLQMRRRGLRVGFAPAIRFEHDTQSISAGGYLLLRPLWKVYYMYRNALIAYRVAAGPWFWPLLPLLVVKWRRQAQRYGDDRQTYRRLLARALADGLRQHLDRSHQEVLAMARGAEARA